MKALTTETILDKQKEKKELMLEINKLKSQKEILKRELKDYTEAKTAIQNEVISGVTVGDLKETVLSNIRAKMHEEIESLIEKKDSFEQAVINSKNEFKFLKEKKAKIVSDIEASTIEMAKINSELEEVKKNKKEELVSLDSKIEKETTKLKEVREKKEEELKLINSFKTAFENREAFLLKEEIRLANKGQDLGIYEARLRKKYLELMPEMVIVV